MKELINKLENGYPMTSTEKYIAASIITYSTAWHKLEKGIYNPNELLLSCSGSQEALRNFYNETQEFYKNEE